MGMRPALVVGATMLLSAVCAAPAAADNVPLPDALAAVDVSCAQTRAALLSSGGQAVDAQKTVTMAVDRFAVTGPGTNRVSIAADGTYGALADDNLRVRDRKAALRYLKRPGATWWLNPGVFWSPTAAWASSFEDSAGAALPIAENCAQELTSAADPVVRDAQRWEFTIPGQGAVVVVQDAPGKLTQFGPVAVSYAVQTISAPSGAVAYSSWQKASQAASLNSTMKQISRSVAVAVNAGDPTVAGIDAATRAEVPTDRVVALKVRQLRRGVLVYGRNPYTKTYHAWRIYLKGGEAIARRVAP